MSGFLMGAAYEKRLEFDPNRVRTMLFLRLARLYPMVFLAATVGLFVAILDPASSSTPASFGGYLRHLALVPRLDGRSEMFDYNSVLWTLMLEIVINILHAALLPWLTRRTLLTTLGASLVFMALLLISGFAHGQGHTGETMVMGLARILVSYTFGLVLFRICRNHPAPWLPVPPWLSPVLLLAIVVTALSFPHGTNIDGFLCISILLPGVLYLGHSLHFGPFWGRIAMLAGAMSYPLYAVHLPLVRAADLVFTRHLDGAGLRAAGWLVFLMLVVVMALAVERWVDRPACVMLKRWLMVRTVPTTAIRPV